jgi:coproporphyrinogen III oxidase
VIEASDVDEPSGPAEDVILTDGRVLSSGGVVVSEVSVMVKGVEG